MTARFVRTQKEMEGRYEDVWVLVDETDDTENWPPDAELTLVGQPSPRHDGHARAAGSVQYTVDVRLAGMLHAAVLRSPVAHGRVRSLDLDAALAVPGVRAAIGPESELSLDHARATSRLRAHVRRPADRGRRGGDARSGARRDCALWRSTSRCSPTSSIRSRLVNEQRFLFDPSDDARGDAEAALAAADVTIELAIDTPAHVQTPLEPHGAVASWDGDRLTAWISTQGIFSCREELTAAFGLRKDDVRVHAEFVGGSFGSKPVAGFEGLAAAELARITGRPVRLVNDRHAEQLDGGRRGATRQTVRLGATD